MLRVRVVLGVLALGLLLGALPASAQAPVPAARGGVSDVGVLGTASLRFGTEAVGVCGEPGYFSPYGDGLGFLEPGKSLHWRLSAHAWHPPAPTSVDLCGLALVPAVGLPELGTAGPCDSVELTGRGHLEIWDRVTDAERRYVVEDVRAPATGSVSVLSGVLPGDPGQEPGRLVMLLQRRTMGMCMHKNHEASRVGTTTYPQGGVGGDVVGVLAYQLPRNRTPTGGCEGWWGQVRRHLGGAGAGLHCPVPSEI